MDNNINKKDKHPSVFEKEISFKDFDLSSLTRVKSKSDQMLPDKDTMNLFIKESNKSKNQKRLPVIILLVILLALFLKFGVVNPVMDLVEANNTIKQYQAELDNCQTQLIRYNEVRQEYFRYSDSYKNDDEAALVDREDVIDLVNECASGLGDIATFSIENNKVSLVIYSSNLDKVSAIRQRLEGYENISDIAVYTANKDQNNLVSVVSTVVFNVKATDDVSAKDTSSEGDKN